MSSVIYTNTASLVAQKNLLGAQNALATSVERLSSGLRINRARDDAAGLSVANSLQSQINGANQGIRNMNDAISMVQTAEGAIAAASDMAQRILTLATQAANGTLGDTERGAIKDEMSQLLTSINSIGTRTVYSNNELLTAQTNGNDEYFSMQISNDSTDKINLSSQAFRDIGVGTQAWTYSALGTPAANANNVVTNVEVFVRTGAGASDYGARSLEVTGHTAGGNTYKLNGIDYTLLSPPLFTRVVDNANTTEGLAKDLYDNIASADASSATSFAQVQSEAQDYLNVLGSQRSLLGAYQNQMEYTLANITELSSNLSAAKSRVIDTDYASETAALTRGQILQQAATAMLAQANQMPNVILTLLK